VLLIPTDAWKSRSSPRARLDGWTGNNGDPESPQPSSSRNNGTSGTSGTSAMGSGGSNNHNGASRSIGRPFSSLSASPYAKAPLTRSPARGGSQRELYRGGTVTNNGINPSSTRDLNRPTAAIGSDRRSSSPKKSGGGGVGSSTRSLNGSASTPILAPVRPPSNGGHRPLSPDHYQRRAEELARAEYEATAAKRNTINNTNTSTEESKGDDISVTSITPGRDSTPAWASPTVGRTLPKVRSAANSATSTATSKQSKDDQVRKVYGSAVIGGFGMSFTGASPSRRTRLTTSDSFTTSPTIHTIPSGANAGQGQSHVVTSGSSNGTNGSSTTSNSSSTGVVTSGNNTNNASITLAISSADRVLASPLGANPRNIAAKRSQRR
jgi:hypothetical protein